MPTAAHAFGGGLEPWHLAEQTIVFFAQPLLLVQIVGESQVADFAAPEPFHSSEIQILEGESIEADYQIMRSLPMKVFALIGNLPMHTR